MQLDVYRLFRGKYIFSLAQNGQRVFKDWCPPKKSMDMGVQTKQG